MSDAEYISLQTKTPFFENRTLSLEFEDIESDKQLRRFCEENSGQSIIGFDTEFVSENRFRPEFCLLQIAAGDNLAIVDTLAVQDLKPFWELRREPGRITIAHAAREEFLFCFRDVQFRPSNLFDLQLAAGLIGMEYPAAYGTLVSKLCNVQLEKGETRTDWSRRPLSKSQIKYALQDVVHLKELHQKINKALVDLNRLDWYHDEVDQWMTRLETAESEPQWRRVPGISGLNRRALATVREIYIWREQEARKKNRSPKRVVPDDLLVEIAKRGSARMDKLKSIRGIDRRVSGHLHKSICSAVDRANQLSDAELPEKPPRHRTQNLGLLGQFVTTALNIVCREAGIASNLVGTASDVRELAAWKLGLLRKSKNKPKLLTGWRKAFVEEWIDDVLAGKVRLRVGNAKSEQPLVIERE